MSHLGEKLENCPKIVLCHRYFGVLCVGLFMFCMLLKVVRGRSQLSTFMKAYTAYARGEGVWDHRTLFPRKSTFIFNH